MREEKTSYRFFPTARAAAWLLVGTCAFLGSCRAPEPESAFLLGGIQVNEPDHGHWMKRLRAEGMNTVSVTVYAHQGAWNTDHMWFDEEAPAVLHEVRAARRAGLRVVLILRVALDHAFEENRFLWHGMIMPETDEQLASWFRRYGELARRWAAIAEREGIDLVGVASELNALTSTLPVDALPSLEEFYLDPFKQVEYKEELLRQRERFGPEDFSSPGAEDFESLDGYLDAEVEKKARWAAEVTFLGDEERLARINHRRALLEEHWRELIRGVRELYSGPLTYAANFDQYALVGFWPQLDVMGINAYFPLRRRFAEGEGRGEVLETLTEGWRGVLSGIEAFQRGHGVTGMGVVFTELGYASRLRCTVAPWAGTGFSMVYVEPQDGGEHEKRLVVWGDQPRDFLERALAIRALARARAEHPGLLQGLLYWKLSTVRDHQAIEPFVVLIDELSEDPMLPELRRFVEPV